jgi:hypothetical protein
MVRDVPSDPYGNPGPPAGRQPRLLRSDKTDARWGYEQPKPRGCVDRTGSHIASTNNQRSIRERFPHSPAKPAPAICMCEICTCRITQKMRFPTPITHCRARETVRLITEKHPIRMARCCYKAVTKKGATRASNRMTTHPSPRRVCRRDRNDLVHPVLMVSGELREQATRPRRRVGRIPQVPARR